MGHAVAVVEAVQARLARLLPVAWEVLAALERLVLFQAHPLITLAVVVGACKAALVELQVLVAGLAALIT